MTLIPINCYRMLLCDWWDSTHSPPQHAPVSTLQDQWNHRTVVDMATHSGGTEIRRDSIWAICPRRYLFRSRRDRIMTCFHFTVTTVDVDGKFQSSVVTACSLAPIPAPRRFRNMNHLLMQNKCLMRSFWKNITWTDSNISNTSYKGSLIVYQFLHVYFP